MQEIQWNDNWKFLKGEIPPYPGMPLKTKNVTLPHDFMIESHPIPDALGGAGEAYFPGSTGTYIKEFDVNQEDLKKVVLLKFDGIFGNTKFTLNGEYLGNHHYGYSPFTLNLSPYLKLGKNKLVVQVNDTAQPSGRWYSGEGIYRNVSLLKGNKIRIAEDSLVVKTMSITNNHAVLQTWVTINDDEHKKHNLTLNYKIIDIQNNQVVLEHDFPYHKLLEDTDKIKHNFVVNNPKLWDIDNPNLYQLKVTLLDDQQEVDSAQSDFGIRTIAVNSVDGFLLNGKSLKLKGGAIHHDNGILGAKTFYDAEYRKILHHKKNGFNAVRLAHNPGSTALLKVCDRLGMIVIDEFFDVWNMAKNTYDFSNFFTNEWKREVKNTMMRDINHPSICFWSIGNEIIEQGGLGHGYETSAKITDFVRKIDNSRPICGALCSFFHGLNDEDNQKFWMTFAKERANSKDGFVNMDNSYGKKIWLKYTEPFANNWDVVGYNYLAYQYEPSHELYPDRVMMATESKPREFLKYWKAVEEHPYVIGDFLWTSQDYLGECGIAQRAWAKPEDVAKVNRQLLMTTYPERTSGAGLFDICGFDRVSAAYHRIVWGSNETYITTTEPGHEDEVQVLGRYAEPFSFHHYSWSGFENQKLEIKVYSRAPKVELLVNGESVGCKEAGKKHDYMATFNIKYIPGNLEAVSYNEDDEEVSRDILRTAGKVDHLEMNFDREALHKNELRANGQDLSFVIIKAVDKNGEVVPSCQKEISAIANGNVKLEALGTGRNRTKENYTQGKCKLLNGQALAIIRAGRTAGDAQLNVMSNDGLEAQANIIVK